LEWYTTAIGCIFILVALMAIGMPVAFTMLVTGLGGLWLSVGPVVALNIFRETIFSVSSNQALATIPLFVLMGQVLLKSEIGADLFEAMHKWGGALPGCLAVGSVGSCAVFGAMCGSSTATTATIGTIAVPTMLKHGYEKGMSTGVVAAAGALGPVIPPSIYLIVYGVVSEQSIGKLFTAAIVPGALLALIMMFQVVFLCKVHPEIAPKSTRASWREKILSIRGLFIPILIIFIVLGSIYLGFCTPTEAAAIGAAGSLISSFASRRLTIKEFFDSVASTLNFSCMVMLLVIGGSLLGKLFAIKLIPQNLGAFTVGLPISPWLIMLAIQLVIFAGGFVIEGCALITILTPVFIPVIKMLGFDPVVFGVAFMMNLATAVITPPFAANLYVMNAIIPEVSFSDIARGALKFLLADLAVLALVLVFPQLSLWLPNVIK